MRAMGERLEFATTPPERDYDPAHRLVAAERSPAERILRALAEHDVAYVLIGGLAVQTHGHVRTTIDADLIPAPDPANLERLAAALRSLDPGVLSLVDVMHEVPGGRPYSELSERALHVRLGEVNVPVVDLDDLIRMKLARGRPTDLADVAALTDPVSEA